jgi:hypothetical protein
MFRAAIAVALFVAVRATLHSPLHDAVNCTALGAALRPTNLSAWSPAVEVAPNATASPPVTFYAALANMTDAERACFSLAWSASTSTTPNATARGSNATFAFAGVTRRAWYATVAVESAATGAVVLRANISASTFALKPNASYVTVAALAQNWTVAACPTPTFLVLGWVGSGPFLLHEVAALEGLRIVGRLPASMLGNRTMNCTAILGRVAAVVATGLGAEVTLGALNYTDVFAELDIDVADLHAAAAGAGVPMALVARGDAEAAGPIRQPVAGIDNLASPLRGTSRTLDCTFSGSAQDGLEGGVHCDFSIVDGALTISVGAGLTLAARLPFVYRISGGELQEAKAGIDGTILGSVSVAAQLAGDVVVDLAKVRLFNHRFYCTHFGFHVPCFVMVGDIPVVYLPYVKGSLSTTFSFVDKASISYSRSVTMSGAIAAVYERGHGGSFEHATSCVPSKGALDVSASCSMALTDGAELEAGVEVMFAIEAAATLGLSDTMSFTQPSPQCAGATEGSLADTVELDVKATGKVFGWDVTVPLWKKEWPEAQTCMSGLPSAVCGPAAYSCRTPEYQCFMASGGASSNQTACADSCTAPPTQCTVCGQQGADSCCNCPGYVGPCSSGCAIYCPCPSSEWQACCMPFLT